MDKVFIVIIILLAAGYLFWKYYRAFTGKESGCGCSSCPGNSMAGPCFCKSDAEDNCRDKEV